MQEKGFPLEKSILSIGSGVRQQIFSSLSLVDAVTLMETSKIFVKDYNIDFSIKKGGGHKSLLEILIENTLWQKIHKYFPFRLNLDDKEDFLNFLYKDLRLDQKKQLFKVLCRHVAYEQDLTSKDIKSNEEKIKLAEKGEGLKNLLTCVLENFQLFNLPLQKKMTPFGSNYFYSTEVKEKLTKISPLLLFLVHIITTSRVPNDNSYLNLALFATQGKDLLTIQRLTLAFLNRIPNSLHLVMAINQDLIDKTINLFKKRFQITENDIKDYYNFLIDLFANTNVNEFDLTFKLLYQKFNNSFGEILKLLPYLKVLLNHPSNFHQWLGLYDNIKLAEIIKNATWLYTLSNLSKEHHQSLIENPNFEKQLKQIISKKIDGCYEPPTVDSFIFFSKFLNHYFNQEGVEQTLNLKNIIYFLWAIDLGKGARLDKVLHFSLDTLNKIPEELFSKFDDVYSFLIDACQNINETQDPALETQLKMETTIAKKDDFLQALEKIKTPLATNIKGSFFNAKKRSFLRNDSDATEIHGNDSDEEEGAKKLKTGIGQ